MGLTTFIRYSCLQEILRLPLYPLRKYISDAYSNSCHTHHWFGELVLIITGLIGESIGIGFFCLLGSGGSTEQCLEYEILSPRSGARMNQIKPYNTINSILSYNYVYSYGRL